MTDLPPLSISAEQLSLERRMATRGIERYHSQQNRALASGRMSVTTPGRRLLVEATHRMVTELQAWLEQAQDRPGPRSGALGLLLPLDPYACCALAIQCIMDGVGRARSSIVCRTGRMLRDELMMESLREQHHPRYGRLQSSAVPRRHRVSIARKWASEDLWDWQAPERPDQIQAGLVLFELAMAHSELFVLETAHTRRKTLTVVRLRGPILAWMERSHDAHEALRPAYLPMVDLPLDWGPDQPGGYRSGLARRKPLAKVQRKAHIEELRQADMPEVYRAVNLAQRTAWRVSPDVLEVLKELWGTNTALAGLPDRECPEFPPRPARESFQDEETFLQADRQWRGFKSTSLRRFTAQGSGRLRVARTLAMATEFVGRTIYYPHHLDFRGRMYPVPPWLTHQGPDLARGLLQFDRSSRVEAGSPAATLFEGTGQDLWRHDGLWEVASAVAQDPLDCLEWTAAHKPWQFLAWCLDAGPWLEDNGHPIRVPVHADGSNNGLQVYALLMRDPTLARATNVTPGPKVDLYQTVADRVWARIQADPSQLAREWRQFLPGLPREATKRPVMTWPYGVRKHSAQAYLRDWLLEEEDARNTRPWGYSNWQATRYLTDLLWEEIQSLIQPAVRCMDWLRGVAKEACPAAVRWTTPVGWPVCQDYPKQVRRSVRASLVDTIRFVHYRQSGSGTSRKDQQDGLPPNFVHSLDSAALVRSMNKAAYRGIQDFAMVHDSYGVPAGDAPLMARTLRESFAEIFSENLLASFTEEVRLHAPEADIPDPPEIGTLDPREVLNSEHFFS